MTLPLPLKVAYTLFVAILVPVYWRQYGPANFLWFSDIALLGTLIALWLESSLVASMQAVSILMLETIWIADFLAKLIARTRLAGIADYMFKPEISKFTRALSLFHLWLPPLLVWTVYRLGYDDRAWLAQTFLSWAVLLLCYFFTTPSANINWVFGPGKRSQHWMPPALYLVVLMILFAVCIYLPAHLVLRAVVSNHLGALSS